MLIDDRPEAPAPESPVALVRRNAKAIAIGMVALGVLLGSGASALALAWPSSGVAEAIATVLPLSGVHAARSEAALERAQFAAADRETREELAIAPVHAEAWLRLARIDAQRSGTLTPAGVDALSKSYLVEPYDLDPAMIRLTFVLDRLSFLPPALRGDVTSELNGLASLRAFRPRLQALGPRIADEEGRAAIAQALAGVDASPPQA